MGTISERVTATGQRRFCAQIVIKKPTPYRESQTFDCRRNAETWMKSREKSLRQPGAILRQKEVHTLGDAPDRYLEDNEINMGRTKVYTLKAIRRDEICDIACEDVSSVKLREYIDRRASSGTSSTTIANDLAHLSTLFKIGDDAYGFKLDYAQILKAQRVGRALKKITSSRVVERVPSKDELEIILAHLEDKRVRGEASIPMVKIVLFALFSPRRSAEITRIRWADFDKGDNEYDARILVRNMKNPGQTKGNNTWCHLPPEAVRIIESMPKTEARIFPFNPRTVEACWQRARDMVDIRDLRFHDLRHGGITRLAEMSMSDAAIRYVSGHRGAASLIRYAHYRRKGDRYAGWEWVDRAIQGHA